MRALASAPNSPLEGGGLVELAAQVIRAKRVEALAPPILAHAVERVGEVSSVADGFVHHDAISGGERGHMVNVSVKDPED